MKTSNHNLRRQKEAEKQKNVWLFSILMLIFTLSFSGCAKTDGKTPSGEAPEAAG